MKPLNQNKMTAVEWLIEEIHKNICFIPVHIQEQAKEMEKQEKIEFACKVYNENYLKDKSFRKIAEELIKSE